MARRDLDLIRNVDEALRGDAFDLIGYASRVLEMLRRPLDQDGEPVSGMPTLAEMVDSTLADAVRQSDALLLAMAPLLDGAGAADSALAERIRTEARGRWRTLPAWLEVGAAPEITGVAAIEHVLGADATLVVGTVLADGTPATATVFVDRDGGDTVSDAFIAPETFAAALAAGTKGVAADEFAVVEVSAADARERISRAIARDLSDDHVLVTESWPACRPMLAWILRALPDGGSGFARADPDDALDGELAAAVEARVPGSDAQARVLIALNRGNSGSGDPRLWSDTFAEHLLLDLLPDEDVADEDPVGLLAALRALVEEGHARAGVAGRLTALTLSAIDELEPDFLDLAATGAEGDPPDDDPAALDLALLALRVGGRRRLDALDTVPITRVVPDPRVFDGRSRAGFDTVRSLVERTCRELFDDAELGIAAARIAELLVESRPTLFDKGKPELAAAAIVWIAGIANDALAPAGPVEVASVMSALGLRGGTPASRAVSYLAVLGVDEPETWAEIPSFADPSLLTSRARRDIIARRDAARAATG